MTIARSHPTDSQRVLFASSVALGGLTWQVAAGHLHTIDHRLAEWVATLRSARLDGLIQAVAWFGGVEWTIGALAALGWWSWRRSGLSASLMYAGAYAGGFGLLMILRVLVGQWRPEATTLPTSMDVVTRFHLAGFPSGHAFRSAFVLGWLAHAMRQVSLRAARLVRFGCLLLIAAVGFTRVYLNRHWASDVVGAWLVAWVALAIVPYWEGARGRQP